MSSNNHFVKKTDEFSGKICLVTGGGSGIGQATCKLLAKLDATLIVADMNLKMAEVTKTELYGQSCDHAAFQVDVSSLNSVKSLAERITKHYKQPPTVIINCAGIAVRPIDSTECSEETWNKIIDVNLKGTFFVNQVFVKLLKDVKLKGTFVNISSVAKDGFEKCTPYSASKSGVEGLTKSLAKEYGCQGFRFNSVAPGATKTPMLDVCMKENELDEYVQTMCTMKRPAMPEEIAEVCAFLASDASSYVNGITMEVSGGRT